MPTVTVRGVDLHYTDEGPADGPLVLMLHGSLRSGAQWARHQRALAEAGYRAVALDDRGHGASTPFGAPANPWAALELPTLVEDAEAFLDAVAPERRVHLVGHSRGGSVGAWLAFNLGAERVASLTVAASPPMASEAFRWHFRRLLESAPAAADYASELRARTLHYLSGIPDDHFAAEFLTQYKGPGLVVEAGGDPTYSPTHTMFWRAWFHGARLQRVEGGHEFLFDGSEGEAAFREHLLGFLAEVAPA